MADINVPVYSGQNIKLVDQGDGTYAEAVTDVAIGKQADAVASSDTGTFSVVALIKRGLQNWTTLLAKIPTLVSGRIPVDGSGVTQPISATSLPLPTGAALESGGNLAAIAAGMTNGTQKTNVLMSLGTPRQQPVTSTSASITLTSTCKAVSLVALTADVCFRVGSGAQTAVTTDHYLQSGERIDIAVAASSSIGVIRAGSTDGVLRISELA